MWVKPWLSRRVTLGHYDTLMQELMRESRGDFKSYLRMEPEMFREMLDRVGPRTEKSPEIYSPYGHHAASLAPVWRPYRHRTVSVRVSCGC